MPPVITAGTYLRMRREAADLSLDDVAIMIGEDLIDRRRWRKWIELIEQDRMPPSPNTVRVLRGAFRFDHYILRQLVAGLAPPALCRTCACSWADPCDDELTGPCAWAEPDRCSHCAARDVAGAALSITA